MLGRQVKRNRGAPPAPAVESTAPAPAVFLPVSPVVEYIASAPEVIQASSVVEYIAPAPGVYAAPAFEEKYIAPDPAVIQAPTPMVESIAPVPVVFQAPVFPLSPDASDTSSPEDEYTRSWESLPVPIKSFTQVESAEPLNLASETPTVFHGRELPAGRRDGLVGHALWLRKEAARRGYAWRQQQRARLEKLLADLQGVAFGNRDRSLTVAELGVELGTRVERQVSVVDMLETRVQETQQVVADLGSSFTELEDDLELRVDEIAKSVLDASKELQVLARSVKNLQQWSDEVAYRHLRPLHDRVTHLEHCLS